MKSLFERLVQGLANLGQAQIAVALSTSCPYNSRMINNMSAAAQLKVVAEGFALIASNFWPVIVIACVAGLVLAYQERSSN